MEKGPEVNALITMGRNSKMTVIHLMFFMVNKLSTRMIVHVTNNDLELLHP